METGRDFYPALHLVMVATSLTCSLRSRRCSDGYLTVPGKLIASRCGVAWSCCSFDPGTRNRILRL